MHTFLALGRLLGSLFSSCATKSLASALMPSQDLRLKSTSLQNMACLQEALSVQGDARENCSQTSCHIMTRYSVLRDLAIASWIFYSHFKINFLNDITF